MTRTTHHISNNASIIAAKNLECQSLAQATEQFLAKGGEIKVIDPSVFADPTNPAPRVMRGQSRHKEPA